jgi:putative membrane protein
MAMGISDLIPGISGGTIALITNVYDDFISSLNNLKIKQIISLFKGDFFYKLKKLKYDFLLILGFGIISSILIFSNLISVLLVDFKFELNSFFFGLILASVPYILKDVKVFTIKNITILLLFMFLSFYLLGVNNFSNEITMTYIFMCGFFCSCAMILPGVSGAYILLIFSSYEFILEKLNLFLSDFNFDDFKWIFVFILGVILGVLSFSRVVRFLLANFKNKTIVALSGLILGSLPKLFPSRDGNLNSDYIYIDYYLLLYFSCGIFLIIVINSISKKYEKK